jgi:hypothetical protein
MYGPNLSELSSVSVRRLAWAMDTNMGKAVDAMVIFLSCGIDTEKVCACCKDKTKCAACSFKTRVVPPENFIDLIK